MKKPSLEEIKEYFNNAKKILSVKLTEFENKESYWDDIECYRFNGIESVYIKNGKFEVWNSNKGYAKILTYKEPKNEVIHELMREWFSSAFVEDKKELPKVFTGWCKIDDMGNDDWIMYFEDGIQQYGIDSNKDWFVPAGVEKIKSYCREATPEEVKEALTKEALKRGYRNGNHKCLNSSITEKNVEDKYLFDNIELWYGTNASANCVFQKGKWAEIIPTITKSEAEQKLNCKII